jgi:hypothetical protein
VRQRGAKNLPEQSADGRPAKKRRGEHAAHRAAAGRRDGGEDLEDQDGEQKHPAQVVVQNEFDHSVTVAPDAGLADRNQPDEQAAQAQLEHERQLRAAKKRFPGAQQQQEKRRDEAGGDSKQNMKRQLPIGHRRKGRHMINRRGAEELGRDHRRRDRGENERAETFQRDGAEHDLRHEERAGKWRVVSASDAGRRATGDQQPQPRRRGFSRAPEQRTDHGRKLHHGTFPPDGTSGRDRDERGKAFHERFAEPHDAVAEDDGLHEIVRPALRRPAFREKQDRSGDKSARGGNQDSSPPRQAAGRSLDRAVITQEKNLQMKQRLAESDRGKRAAKADDGRPEIG